MIQAIMLSELVCDKEAKKYRQDDLSNREFRRAYTDILTCADIGCGGPLPTRPYTRWVRDRDKLLPLGRRNIRWMAKMGFRVILCPLNACGIKHGYGLQQGAVQRRVSESRLYDKTQFRIEKKFYANLLDDVGPYIYGIMPCLEGLSPDAYEFCLELAKYLRRKQNFEGEIIFNLIGAAHARQRKKDLRQWDILSSSSINNIGRWKSSKEAVRNSDGATSVTASDPRTIRMMRENPGPAGYIIWSKEFIGGPSGRHNNIPRAYYRYYP